MGGGESQTDRGGGGREVLRDRDGGREEGLEGMEGWGAAGGLGAGGGDGAFRARTARSPWRAEQALAASLACAIALSHCGVGRRASFKRC